MSLSATHVRVLLALWALGFAGGVVMAEPAGPWKLDPIRNAADLYTAGEATRGETCGPLVLALVGDPCFELESEVVVSIEMSNASFELPGGQFFLAYNTEIFDVLSVDPGDPPFVMTMWRVIDEDAGLIDYAVAIPPGWDPTDQDTTMARITFLVVGDQGDPYVVWRDHHPETWPYPSTLINLGQGDDVDLSDYAAFQTCFTGDGPAATEDCRCTFDTDSDLDVDELDYLAFLAIFDGPSIWECPG